MYARRVLLNVVLAICLLLSQQAALAHAISHLGALGGGQSATKTVEISAHVGSQAADEFCLECLAFAQVAAAATGSVGFDAVTLPAVLVGIAPAEGRDCSLLLSFRARAPPCLL